MDKDEDEEKIGKMREREGKQVNTQSYDTLST